MRLSQSSEPPRHGDHPTFVWTQVTSRTRQTSNSNGQSIFQRHICIYSNLTPYLYIEMGREDQVEEREVLDSIFPEEITGRKKALVQ